jgi:hypothetical protein
MVHRSEVGKHGTCEGIPHTYITLDGVLLVVRTSKTKNKTRKKEKNFKNTLVRM